MGIWIRSQDRKTLSNGNTKIYIRISNSGFGIDWECLANDYNGTHLADYSTEDKAIKVLDMIHSQINDNWEFAPIDDRLGTQRLKVGVDKVFVMPQDSEVIVDET